ncbi:MAG: pentapeptide repeat-containing protein [Treponema sp.]|nr:pentapeptide repeat-containing protein [Treponema sp.]
MIKLPVFAINPCAAGCGRPAINGSNICFLHQANQEQETQRIVASITESSTVKDMCVIGMRFTDVDFSNRRYYGCNFREAVFSKCLFTGSLMRMCFFDFAEFTDCDFSKSDLQFLSFAGARISNSLFEESELVHANFLGAAVSGTSFNHSNLYNSRFINAQLEKSEFVNCNLKRVYFINASQKDTNFKASNTAEAIHEMEEP